MIPTITCWVEVVRWGLSSSSRSEAVWEWIQDSMWCQFVEELRFVSASSPPRLRQQHQQLLTKFHFHITPVIHLPLFSILRLKTPKPNPNVILCAHPVSILSITKFSHYVRLIGSGEGRHTTHLLKCVLLLSTSQTDWKQSSDVLSDISFDILSDIFWYIFWHSFWHIFWHIFRYSFWHLSDISFDILSDISSDILSDISFDMLSDISSDILSDISKPKPNIHSFTKKAALQTLYLPHTTQQK